MEKMWQMMRSKDTETLNLDKDLEDLVNKVKQAGWNESTKTKIFWTQDEDEDEDQSSLQLCTQSCSWTA